MRCLDPYRQKADNSRIIDGTPARPFGRGEKRVVRFPGIVNDHKILVPDWARMVKVTVPQIENEYFLFSRNRIINPNIASFTESFMDEFWNRPINSHEDSLDIPPPAGIGTVHKVVCAGVSTNIVIRTNPTINYTMAFHVGVLYSSSLYLYIPSGQPEMDMYRFSTDYNDGDTQLNAKVDYFDKWIRHSTTTLITNVTRKWIDFNVLDNASPAGTIPPAGTVFYIAGAQIQVGGLTAYKPVLNDAPNFGDRIVGDEYAHIESGEWVYCDGLREFYLSHRGFDKLTNFYGSIEFI